MKKYKNDYIIKNNKVFEKIILARVLLKTKIIKIMKKLNFSQKILKSDEIRIHEIVHQESSHSIGL